MYIVTTMYNAMHLAMIFMSTLYMCIVYACEPDEATIFCFLSCRAVLVHKGAVDFDIKLLSTLIILAILACMGTYLGYNFHTFV